MSRETFWARVVFVSGILMAVWNSYVLFRVHAGWADKIFRALMIGVILLITWIAYGQSKRGT